MAIEFHESECRRTLIEHEARYRYTLPLVAGRRILDIGCAARGGSARLGGSAASVIAVDVNPEQVEWARTNHPRSNVVYRPADACALPFGSEFEAVVCLDVIEHIPDWGKALDELARVVAPGGRLILTTPNAKSPSITSGRALPNDHHVHEFEPMELQGELVARGLVVGEFRGFSWDVSVDRKAEPFFVLVRALDPFGLRRSLGWAARQFFGRVARRASGAVLDEKLDASLYREIEDPCAADYLWLVCEKPR